MKNRIRILFLAVPAIIIYGCGRYISYHDKTTNSLELFKQAVKLPVNDTLPNMKQIDIVYKGQSKTFGKNSAWKAAAEDKIKNQLAKFKEVNQSTKLLFEKYFSKNSCTCGSWNMNIFVRKILAPQTFYSHLSSPFRGESYVFYIFTDYDAATGLGRYYQTDAFYPRDAFSFDASDLCPDGCIRKNKIEFFTGVFYLTHSGLIRKDIIALLGPENDINDRKEFTIEIINNNKLKFSKAFEYKFYNYYPIVQGNYILEQRDPILCSGNTRSVFEAEYNELEHLNGSRAVNSMVSTDSQNDTTKNLSDYRDYFYPLKGNNNWESDTGYVFFGQFDIKKNVSKETFYHYKTLFGAFNLNSEIKCMKDLENARENKRSIKPFDIIKMRNEIMQSTDTLHSNFNDASIVGEARPGNLYRILEIDKLKNKTDSIIWLKIERTDRIK